jgi:hypothetical protein
MRVNTYLPDELGERAKAAGLAFSAILQKGVEDELERLGDLERLTAALGTDGVPDAVRVAVSFALRNEDALRTFQAERAGDR